MSSTISKRPRPKIYTEEDVALHKSAGSCWVIVENKVYDVTSFVNDHPGGDDLILDHAGKNITAVMSDPDEHSHSDSAYMLMSDFLIGIIGNTESTCSEDTQIDEHFAPEETAMDADYERNQFLDLSKPLIMQVWHSNFSKRFYLQQVHQPRHLPGPARLFGPWYLEMLTRTNWYIVPLFWGPIVLYLLYLSLMQQATINPVSGKLVIGSPSVLLTIGVAFLFGNFVWTVLEYTMHRFVFHVDDYLPDHPLFLMLHFTMHGVHHYLPTDRLRLVMPPTLFAGLSYPFTRLAYALFSTPIANAVIAGSFTFYILYDMMHYALHHTQLPKYMRDMKIYHMAHHFKNFELGYGVTSKFWDVIFRTELKV